MSGHSRWATIKRKKGAADAKRGKIFTKLVREITTAARVGGGDITANPRLRAAVTMGKAEGMPNDTITRAIKKGTGELEGPPVEECAYEGYAPGGVAIYVETQTDNRNRTSAAVRSVFSKANGSLGAPGSVAYMFKKVGLITFDADKYSEEEIMEKSLDAGAQDVSQDGNVISVTCDPKDFSGLLEQLEKGNYTFTSADIIMAPENTTPVAGKDAEQVLRLIEKLEDLDDVQKVWANFDIADDELERIASEG
jgi:YebC/PmpR family DNA-binding regulatory protein